MTNAVGPMPQRWLRIIPIALLMYTISYVDRTNVILALDPQISGMMADLRMDDRLKGLAAGIFFLGYVLLQVPGGHWASTWSARKVIAIFLVGWGFCAVAAGFCQQFWQLAGARFLLGVAESGVFPATLVLLANWFPRTERARANAYWFLCQPLAIMAMAPVTGWLLGRYGWRVTLVLEGALPFLWLPLWWWGISDHPREASWISAQERRSVETTLAREAQETAQPLTGSAVRSGPITQWLCRPLVGVSVLIYFLHNCAAYGCMFFFTDRLKGQGLSPITYGLLFALPYAITAILMVINSWHSDKTRERRAHAAAAYFLSGLSLILAVSLKGHFWLSYAFLCLAIPGPFVAMGPFWSIPGELLPRHAAALAFGVINAFGNLGGFVGPSIVGYLKQAFGGVTAPFNALGCGMLLAAALAFLLPKRAGAADGSRA